MKRSEICLFWYRHSATRFRKVLKSQFQKSLRHLIARISFFTPSCPVKFFKMWNYKHLESLMQFASLKGKKEKNNKQTIKQNPSCQKCNPPTFLGRPSSPGHAPLPCAVRKSPPKSPPAQKAKPNQELHILPLALSFPEENATWCQHRGEQAVPNVLFFQGLSLCLHWLWGVIRAPCPN